MFAHRHAGKSGVAGRHTIHAMPSRLPITAPPAPPARPATTPLHLPRLVMRRAAAVSALVLLLALLLGLLRMNQDIDDEVDAGMTLAALMARLASLAQEDDQPALAALRQLQAERPLRHLALHVRTADGRELLAPPPEPPSAWPLRALLSLHRNYLSPTDQRQVAWVVPRPSGAPWRVALAASHEAERREAMTNFAGTLGLLLAAIAGLLLAMHWNMRRAFAPLGRLLAAISGVQLHDARALLTLPTMPIRELEAVAAALRRMAGALDAAEAQRRQLSQQVLTLQDDERARLARELHDEYGQRLTALRVDTAWLARRLAEQPALLPVVAGMAANCEHIQHDIRALLTRLQPFGHPDADAAGGEALAELVRLLRALVAGWQPAGLAAWADPASPACGAAVDLQLQWLDDSGQALPWPADAGAALLLPHALALTLYRISQESLTNVARHAGAQRATLALQVIGAPLPGAPARLHWSVSDDGAGLDDPDSAAARGNGLAGVRERVWAQGADLHVSPAQPASADRPGLRLQASFEWRWALRP